MKVILQEDVKNVGKVGDLVRVAPGFARNFLFPRKLAVVATENKVTEWAHLQRVAEVKKQKASAQRKSVAEKLQGMKLVFQLHAGENDKLFGSVTNVDISNRLQTLGFSIDRRDIHIVEPIKLLGVHPINIKFGGGIETTLDVVVEKLHSAVSSINSIEVVKTAETTPQSAELASGSDPEQATKVH